MICQSIKREQWLDKLKNTLLEVPYMHVVFTVPHQLNSLCRQNQKLMYSLVMKVAWKTIKSIGTDHGYNPGMTSVLHTFGSDMKYHIHVHSLVTYGGLTNNKEWKFPKVKNKLERYEKICKRYRQCFLDELQKLKTKHKLIYHQDLNLILSTLINSRWVVHSTKPTMNTAIIENYLARYINRVAISPNRLHYAKELAKVNLLYNDYKNQSSQCPAPKRTKTLIPLEAIHQILQHSLPPYFQKSRRYGLHNESSSLHQSLPSILKRNGQTVRTLFEILTQILKSKPFCCDQCGCANFTISILKSDPQYILNFLSKPGNSPPNMMIAPTNPAHYYSQANGTPMSKIP